MVAGPIGAYSSNPLLKGLISIGLIVQGSGLNPTMAITLLR